MQFKVFLITAVGHEERLFEADYHRVDNGVLTLRKHGSPFPPLVACFAAGAWKMITAIDRDPFSPPENG